MFLDGWIEVKAVLRIAYSNQKAGVIISSEVWWKYGWEGGIKVMLRIAYRNQKSCYGNPIQFSMQNFKRSNQN